MITWDLLEALPGVIGDVGGLRTEDCTESAGADRLTASSVWVRVRQRWRAYLRASVMGREGFKTNVAM